MYLVDCPKCGRSLRMRRAVTEAKLKCRFCQAVFVGSTRLSPEVSESCETLPVHAPKSDEVVTQYHRLPKRRRPVVQAGIMLIGLAGVVVLGAWLYHKYQNQQTIVPEPQPKPAVTKKPSSRVEKEPVAKVPENVNPQPSSKMSPTTAHAAGRGGKIDPVEVIECARLPGPEEASASFVGTYENHSDSVLRSVHVVVMVSRENGEILQASSHKYEAIPPNWRGRFSADADFRFSPGMRIAWVESHSDPAPELRGWLVEDMNSDISDDDTIHVTGLVENTTKETLNNPVIRCDFFTKQGLYVGSAQGTLHKNPQSLKPGETVSYDIQFDPKQAGSSSRLLAEPKVRLLGTTKP